MRKKRLDMMNAIDDELIDRANPANLKPQKRRLSSRMIGAIAACLVIAVVAVNLIIFLPKGDDILTGGGPSQDRTDDNILPSIHNSYDQIKAILDENGFRQYNTNDAPTSDGESMAPAPGGAPSGGNSGGSMDDTGSSNDSNGSYVEVTDNQVSGVVEADIFKRTTTHIFYLRENGIYAYSIGKDNSRLVGEYAFTNDFTILNKEMYLSSDGKTATVIYSTSSYPFVETKVVFIDVSNPEKMETKKCTSFKGSYQSSRYVDGELLLFTNFTAKDTKKTENYIPAVDTGKGYELIKPGCIVAPEKCTSVTYLVVSKLDGDTLGFGGSIALLGYSGAMYVSGENIYATRTVYDNKTVSNIYYYESKSDIVRISYKNDLLSIMGAITVAGTIKDQYCMDEKDGVLRVFTTTNDGYHTVYNGSGGSSGSSSGSVSGGTATTTNPGTIDPAPPVPTYPDDETTSSDTISSSATSSGTTSSSATSSSATSSGTTSSSTQDHTSASITIREPLSDNMVVAPMSYKSGSNRSASLYCIDIEKMEVIASVENFAPQGESVQSARFDVNTAYVCTAIVFTDPVFVFDLSDLSNITYKDTGNIEGYSHSLVELKDGYLLGIGQTGWSTIKLELYKEEESELVSVSKVELTNCYGTDEYKAHYINREEMVFGFAYERFDYNSNQPNQHYYDIYKIVDGKIVLAESVSLSPCWVQNCRGVLVDDYFYILTDATEKNTVFDDNFYFVPIN